MGVYSLVRELPLSHARGLLVRGHTARGPFRAILLRLMLSIAVSGIAVLPSLRMGSTLIGSHEMGVYHRR